MTRVRIGWIGCGTHANEMLLPQLARHDVTIAALCDTDGGPPCENRRALRRFA